MHCSLAVFDAVCLLRGAKKSTHSFHQWKVLWQGTESTNRGLRALLYSSLGTKAAKGVFKSDGAERTLGCSAWESWQGKGVAKQVTEQGTVRRAGEGWYFNLYWSIRR